MKTYRKCMYVLSYKYGTDAGAYPDIYVGPCGAEYTGGLWTDIGYTHAGEYAVDGHTGGGHAEDKNAGGGHADAIHPCDPI